MISKCITDDNAIREAANNEIIRRYYNALANLKQGKASNEEVERIEILMNKLNLSKDFWLISEFLEQIDFKFSNLAKDNHYNMYYHQYRYHYKSWNYPY